eukprot:GHVP01029958.1.p1 GENE.GHVP01029958.1~~GHVP01029958.1.p1  ORF type:complete len:233 (-),score=18.88 GHVP01029958.1:73-771(-)
MPKTTSLTDDSQGYRRSARLAGEEITHVSLSTRRHRKTKSQYQASETPTSRSPPATRITTPQGDRSIGQSTLRNLWEQARSLYMGFGNETTHQVEPTKGIQDIIVHKRRNFQANKLNSSNDNSKGHNKPIHHEARTQSFPPQNEGFHEESLHHLELHQEAHHPTHRHAAQDRLQHRTHESQAFTRNGQLLSQELISLRGTEQGFHGPTFKHNKGPWNYYNMPSRNYHNYIHK